MPAGRSAAFFTPASAFTGAALKDGGTGRASMNGT